MKSAARVLIADRMSPRAAEILGQMPGIEVLVRAGMSKEELIAEIAAYDAVAVRSATKLPAEVLSHATRLRVIGRAGIGVDNVDVEAATARGILVMNTPFGNATTTAEHAIAMLMALSRNIPQATASMRAGKWEKKSLQGREVTGKTLGVIGLGNIGRIVANRARGLHMNVIGFDPQINTEAARGLGVERVELDELFARADYVSVHTPLNDATRHLLGAEAFARMKPGAFVINCARGGIVDEAALVAALDEGRIAGAALDVYETEPPPADQPLLSHPKVILTPHLGASTAEAQEIVAVQIAEQIGAFLTEGTVTNGVNSPSVSGPMLAELDAFFELGRCIGALGAQIHGAALDRVELRFAGTLREDERRPITARALAAVMAQRLGRPVNAISAGPLAFEAGVRVETTDCGEHPDFDNSVTLRLVGDGEVTEVEGAVIGEREIRVEGINGFRVDLKPVGHFLLITNEDRPGVIGAVGTVLGERGINVARLSVGQRARGGGEALAVWSTNDPVPDEVVDRLRATPAVARVLRLDVR